MSQDELNPYKSPETEAGSDRESPEQGAPIPAAHDASDSIETVASYMYASEACLAQALLAAEGIDSQLADEAVAGGFALWSNAIGGVKVVVRSRDAEQAKRFLHDQNAALQAKKNHGDVEFECEECGAPLRFPGSRRGCVETCPECRDFIDVPD